MAGVKFYVLGGGRWRELNMSSGHVEGWGAAQFLVAGGGRLRAERRAPVLRGLLALASGRPTTVHDGPMLSQIRYSKISKPKPCPAPQQNCGPCHFQCHTSCCPIHNGCGVNSIYNEVLTLQQAGPRVSHVSVQADLTDATVPRQSYQHGHNNNNNRDDNTQSQDTEIKVTYRTRDNKVRGNYKTSAKEIQDETTAISSETEVSGGRPEGGSGEEGGGEGLCKELIVAGKDVALLRDFLVKDERNVFDVDLETFDADDSYKRRVLYKFNPLVTVERYDISDVTRGRDTAAGQRGEGGSQSTVAVNDFMSTLGLRKVGGDDKENDTHTRVAERGGRGKGTVLRDSTGKSNREKNRHDQKEKGNKRRSQGRGGGGGEEQAGGKGKRLNTSDKRVKSREYSALEDAVIVRWVCAGEERRRRVKGNLLWRELQGEHHRLTGHYRSWHSLRNRYLRYLLPSLSTLVSPQTATQLRAAAAAGEMKTRDTKTNNSFHHLAPVTSAWAKSNKNKRPQVPRVVRSGGVISTPTYDQLTRRFNDQHKRTSASSDVTESETERRFSKRLRPDLTDVPPHRPHTRRLYNHAM